MAFLRPLLLLCFILPSSNSIKCFTCIGTVSFQFCSTILSNLSISSRENLFCSVYLPQAAHLPEHPWWEGEGMPSWRQLLRAQVLPSSPWKLHFALQNLIVGWESGTRTSTITTVVVPMASLDGLRTMRLTLEAAALPTSPKVLPLNVKHNLNYQLPPHHQETPTAVTRSFKR